jgi:hypothetical protein
LGIVNAKDKAGNVVRFMRATHAVGGLANV